MTGYLLRRAGQSLLVLVLLSIATFGLLHILPGGPAFAMLGREASPAEIADFNHEMGYDRPLPVQYAIWIARVGRGDLGFSYRLNEPVAAAIGQALPKTIALMLLATAVAAAVSVALGAYQATHRNHAIDHVITGTMFLLFATPSFFFGLLLVLVFAVYAHLLPPQAPQSGSLVDILSDPLALVLPIVTLAVIPTAVLTRYARSSVIDN